MISLPLRGDGTPHYSFDVQIEAQSFTFEFRWNSRAEFWACDIYDSTGEAIVTGRRVVIGPSMFWRFKSESLPTGHFVVADTASTDTDPTLDDFGTRVVIYYLTAEEAATLVA